ADNEFVLNETIQGAYDPNDKQVSHEKVTMAQVSAQQPLTYTVRFQNTGTDTAFAVMVRDELSDMLDMNTLEVISVSHPYSVQFSGAKTIDWGFANILLPDSNTNEVAS